MSVRRQSQAYLYREVTKPQPAGKPAVVSPVGQCYPFRYRVYKAAAGGSPGVFPNVDCPVGDICYTVRGIFHPQVFLMA
ncbi:hypothetical protein [Sinomicrobium sp. M5D2P9]